MSLASLLESIPLIRRRFRKGVPWIREPVDCYGEKSVQTTKAVELNYSTLRVLLIWMQTGKVSIKQLEPEARVLT